MQEPSRHRFEYDRRLNVFLSQSPNRRVEYVHVRLVRYDGLSISST